MFVTDFRKFKRKAYAHEDLYPAKTATKNTKKAGSKQQNKYFEALKSVSFGFIQKINYLHTN